MPTKRSNRWGGGSRRRGRPRLRLTLPVLGLAALAAVLGLTLPGHRTTGPTAALPAPNGKPMLVSFLDTQAQPSANGSPSRSQLVFLKSMDTQSHTAGLRTVVVDAAHALKLQPPSVDDLVNVRYDWALPPSIRVLGDADGTLEKAYGVTRVPTTLLIDGHGAVLHRWTGFASAAQLDFAVRRATGRHVFGQG